MASGLLLTLGSSAARDFGRALVPAVPKNASLQSWPLLVHHHESLDDRRVTATKLRTNEVREIVSLGRDRTFIPTLHDLGPDILRNPEELPTSPPPVLRGQVAAALVLIEKTLVKLRNSLLRRRLLGCHLVGKQWQSLPFPPQCRLCCNQTARRDTSRSWPVANRVANRQGKALEDLGIAAVGTFSQP